MLSTTEDSDSPTHAPLPMRMRTCVAPLLTCAQKAESTLAFHPARLLCERLAMPTVSVTSPHLGLSPHSSLQNFLLRSWELREAMDRCAVRLPETEPQEIENSETGGCALERRSGRGGGTWARWTVEHSANRKVLQDAVMLATTGLPYRWGGAFLRIPEEEACCTIGGPAFPGLYHFRLLIGVYMAPPHVNVPCTSKTRWQGKAFHVTGSGCTPDLLVLMNVTGTGIFASLLPLSRALQFLIKRVLPGALGSRVAENLVTRLH